MQKQEIEVARTLDFDVAITPWASASTANYILIAKSERYPPLIGCIVLHLSDVARRTTTIRSFGLAFYRS